MKSMPADRVAYKRTPEFDQTSVPPGLLKAHKTKTGTWAKIVVLQGELAYRINEPELQSYVLNTATVGIVEPGVAHEVEPIGAVRFYVEFYK